jgi:hypothetical protein
MPASAPLELLWSFVLVKGELWYVYCLKHARWEEHPSMRDSSGPPVLGQQRLGAIGTIWQIQLFNHLGGE